MSEESSQSESEAISAESSRHGELNAGWKKRHDAVFIAMLVGSLLLLIALMSYSPEQGGWTAIGHGSEQNAAGQVGAYLADFLFHTLGYLAFAIPLLILARSVVMFRRRSAGPWYTRLGGILITLITLCALAEVSIWQSVLLPAGPGGALGRSLVNLLLPLFGFAGSAVILVAGLALGLMLFLEFSWLAVFEKIGGWLLGLRHRTSSGSGTEAPQSDLSADESFAQDTIVAEPPAGGETDDENKLSWWGRFRQRFARRKAAPVAAERAEPRLTTDAEPIIADFSALDSDDEIPWLDEVTDPPPAPVVVADKTQPSVDVAVGKEALAEGIIPVKKTPQRRERQAAAAPSVEEADIPIQPLEKNDAGPSERAVRELQGSLFKGDQPLPSIALLDAPRTDQGAGFSPERLKEMSRLLVQKLADFGVKIEVTAVAPGPVITRFEIQPAPGVKASKISGLAQDLARSMAMVAVRVVEVIPGKSVMGIEVPNENRAVVSISEVLASQQYDKTKSPLTIALGHDIGGNPVVTDLAKAPHMLVAGTTGSGKSVGVNAMLISMLFKATPEELRLILVDPKMLELSVYEGIPHLLTPVITDMKEAHNGLRWSVEEMERRYQLMAAMGVRNIAGFNKKVREAIEAGKPIADPTWQIDQSFDTTPPTLEPLPYIVIVIDEFADMMMMVGKKVEELIARIAQKARAAGIHMILATQRPSVDVITGLIKANVPTRIAFQVSSKIDSRTILDQGGAEQLLGHGDMLFMPPGNALPERIHGAFVDDDEVHRVVAEWKQRGAPDYIEEITQGGEDNGVPGLEGGDEKDDLYDQAVAFVTESGKCSISSVQRKLRIGYNRAARLVETMEAAGVVSPPAHNGAREVIARAAPQ